MNAPSVFGQVPAAVVAMLLLLSSDPAPGQWPVPESLQERVRALSDEQAGFVTSGEALRFLPERQLEHELATRTAQDLRSLIDDLMSLAVAMGYDPQRDMGAAPLNLDSKRFNRMQTPVPLREGERAPGPFSVHRYLLPKSGVPTFGGAKVAIWPEDLVAGEVDVAIIGVPNNMSSGRRDAGAGPDAMRAMNTIAMPDDRTLVVPLEALSVVDYGNFAIDHLSTERTVGHVTDMVAETAATGAIPMMVGGDTSMLYPGVKGVAQVQGKKAFGLLHFSAHPDAERQGDHTVSDRQALFLLLEEGIVGGGDVIQLGMRGPQVDAGTLQWLRDQEVRYHTMAEIRHRGPEAVLKGALREVERGPDKFFVSVDVSAIDPAEMIAAGRLAAHGLRIEAVARTVREVCATKDIVGFEITDLAPMLDLSRLSVTHANALLNACLNGVALTKSGLSPDYIHPLVLGHGQR